MHKSSDPYERSVRSLNDSDRYELSGESEYSRERSDPYQMVDYLIDRGVDFRGRGPKGWRPDDIKIRDEVCEVLARDYRIDAVDIEVDVKDGVVFLRGRVGDRGTKRLAELVVENLFGVNDIVNQLSFKK